jgi:hypothetical protein
MKIEMNIPFIKLVGVAIASVVRWLRLDLCFLCEFPLNNISKLGHVHHFDVVLPLKKNYDVITLPINLNG